jgi:hypothetical protein
VAVVVCYAGPWIAALVGGIGGFFTTLAVQAGLWLRKVLAIDAAQAVRASSKQPLSARILST